MHNCIPVLDLSVVLATNAPPNKPTSLNFSLSILRGSLFLKEIVTVTKVQVINCENELMFSSVKRPIIKVLCILLCFTPLWFQVKYVLHNALELMSFAGAIKMVAFIIMLVTEVKHLIFIDSTCIFGAAK